MIKVIHYSMYDKAAAQRIERAVAARRVSVGIPQNAAYPNGEKVGDVALALEFGNGNMPPRSFVRNPIAARRDEIRQEAGEALKAAVKAENGMDGKKAAEKVGEKVKAVIVDGIDTLEAPPLKPATIEAKKRKGRRKPEKPLIDSGLLRKSVKVRVE